MVLHADGCQSCRGGVRTAHLLDTEGLQSPQFDGLGGPSLWIVKHQASTAIDFDSRCALHVEMAIAVYFEFQYEVQVVHFSFTGHSKELVN